MNQLHHRVRGSSPLPFLRYNLILSDPIKSFRSDPKGFSFRLSRYLSL
ncbi:unnamed protein product, partial [Musa banksii]